MQNTEDFRSFEVWDRLMSAGGYPANSRSHRSADGEWDRQRALWTPGAKLILSEHGNHALFDLERDPEEELNLFGAPRPDFFNQYTHFPDQTARTARLTRMLREEARRVGDDWGAALAASGSAFSELSLASPSAAWPPCFTDFRKLRVRRCR